MDKHHLTGPAEHSQFIYEIKSVARTTSRLKFTALHIARNIFLFQFNLAELGVRSMNVGVIAAFTDITIDIKRKTNTKIPITTY